MFAGSAAGHSSNGQPIRLDVAPERPGLRLAARVAARWRADPPARPSSSATTADAWAISTLSGTQ